MSRMQTQKDQRGPTFSGVRGTELDRNLDRVVVESADRVAARVVKAIAAKPAAQPR